MASGKALSTVRRSPYRSMPMPMTNCATPKDKPNRPAKAPSEAGRQAEVGLQAGGHDGGDGAVGLAERKGRQQRQQHGPEGGLGGWRAVLGADRLSGIGIGRGVDVGHGRGGGSVEGAPRSSGVRISLPAPAAGGCRHRAPSRAGGPCRQLQPDTASQRRLIAAPARPARPSKAIVPGTETVAASAPSRPVNSSRAPMTVLLTAT